ncbi:MAG: hypothetical protein U0T02_06115 [Solirubrobacteraceae bacterium]
MSLEAEMLAFIRGGLDHHNATCPMPAQAILLNPGNHELFGWDELWGIPVIPDDRVPPKRFRIQCDGSAFGIEEEVEALSSEPAIAPGAPLEVPIAPGREGEPRSAR